MLASILHVGLALAVIFSIAGCVPHRSLPSASTEASQEATSVPQSNPDVIGSQAQPKALLQPEAGGIQTEELDSFVEQGTGQLVAEPKPLAGDALVRDDAGDITLNVVDADIREVVRLVLEDGLNVNYVIDPTITGSTTIRTSRPVPAGDVLPLLNSVLNANGAALVRAEGLYKVVPLGQSPLAGGKPSTRLTLKKSKVGSGLLVAPLRFANVTELAELLEPFADDQGALQLDVDRNTLLFAGSADQITMVSELIDMFDVDWMTGMSFGFYPLSAAQASALAAELDQIFGGDGDEDADGEVVRFVPIDRLNALLVITAQPEYLRRAQTWIERLDKVGEGDEEQIFVYPVQNGRATDLASVLGELFDIESTVIGPESLLAPGFDPIEMGSSLLQEKDDPTEGNGRRALGERQPFRQRDRISAAAPVSQRVLTEGREGDTTKIVADEGNNALLIKAVPKDYKKIEAALRELDKPPLQILLEATIAEVTLKDELRYGIQWFFNSNDSSATFSSNNNGTVEPNFPGFAGILSRGDVRVVIDALDEISDVQVIFLSAVAGTRQPDGAS